jgi:hypothetical protein
MPMILEHLMMLNGWWMRSVPTVGRATSFASKFNGTWLISVCDELEALDRYLALMGVDNWQQLPRKVAAKSSQC